MQAKRILLKISGEALAGAQEHGFDKKIVSDVAKQIADAVKSGVEVALVLGGGNFWRGRQNLDMDRSSADYIGMLATVMNAICMQNALEAHGVKAIVQSAINIDRMTDPFDKRRAVEALKNGNVVIFGGGTGHPFFSTDTTSALRAAEIGADALFFARKVDGIYDSDPATNKKAKRFKEIGYIDFIDQRLKAMDTTAVSLCMDNDIPVFCFGLYSSDNVLYDALTGNLPDGTWIK